MGTSNQPTAAPGGDRFLPGRDAGFPDGIYREVGAGRRLRGRTRPRGNRANQLEICQWQGLADTWSEGWRALLPPCSTSR